jgi:hypothetical protein
MHRRRHVMNLASYWNADKLVLAMHDAHEVDGITHFPRERQCFPSLSRASAEQRKRLPNLTSPRKGQISARGRQPLRRDEASPRPARLRPLPQRHA